MVLQAWSMFMLLSLSDSDAADANGDDDDELLFFMMTMVVVVKMVVASLKATGEVVCGLRRGWLWGLLTDIFSIVPSFSKLKPKCTSTNG